MWIVRLALRQKFTFVVMAIFIALLGVMTCFRTPIDILPEINVPVVAVIWSYNGLSATDMVQKIVTTDERAMTTTVNDIEHIESRSVPGIGVIKVYFQANADPQAGVAQVTAICQTLLRAFPPGTTPPLIIQYSASNVPVVQLGVGSKTLSESQLYDLSTNTIRTAMATIQGAAIPTPYGGKPRLINIDLDMEALRAKGLSPSDVGNAVAAGNVILPAGTAKIGPKEYYVHLNGQPTVVDELNSIPIRTANGAQVYLRDVAYAHDGFSVQSNIVNQNGKRAALVTILTSGQASTVDVVNRVKANLPYVRTLVPKGLNLNLMFDQSIFVEASVKGVIREAAIAAGLTAFMVLLFLGSWRAMIVVAISIPLSILASLTVLGAIGETINIMTLGGLALSVGILVDDATVEIENTNRNLAIGGKALTRAILDSANEIAVPTFIATISICIVFVPVFLLSGTAKYLFEPLALAVVFAMLTSYLLSRTLVPLMMQFLLPKDVDRIVEEESEENQRANASAHVGAADSATVATEKQSVPGSGALPPPAGIGGKIDGYVWGVHRAFSRRFESFREHYSGALAWSLAHRKLVSLIFVVCVALSACLYPFIGRNFFPSVDAGLISLHITGLPGTRLEETDHLFNQVEKVVRQTIPANEVDTIIDNIGLPVGGINLAFSNSPTIGSLDGDMQISLVAGTHGSVESYTQALRSKLSAQFPNDTFQFLPADITTQILNAGLPAPIDIQVQGNDPGNYALALQIAHRVKRIPGAVDVVLHQVVNAPQIDITVDRQRAGSLGLTENDAANNLLLSLTGSSQSSPGFFVDPKTGVSYSVNIQTQQRDIRSVADLENTPVLPSTGVPAPVTTATAQQPEMISNIAAFKHDHTPQVINHYNVQPIYDVYVAADGRDLGGVDDDVEKVLAPLRKHLARGTLINVRGQVSSMDSSFKGLAGGMILAITLVYLLLAVNFQSWIDPIIIISALPGAGAGVLWALFLSHTTFSVPALMGGIMSIGVGTSNSILLVTFANDRRVEGDTAVQAAQAAGFTRLRPVLMTALALVLGMGPMALGLGEGGEQNAPLGRAVIGGCALATLATLFFVPIAYSFLREKQPSIDANLAEIDKFTADEEALALRRRQEAIDSLTPEKAAQSS